jgi:hypothetical protein
MRLVATVSAFAWMGASLLVFIQTGWKPHVAMTSWRPPLWATTIGTDCEGATL